MTPSDALHTQEPDYLKTSLLIGYQIIVLISSLVGDIIILSTTVNGNAFRLNVLLVVVIQHIAVNNLALCLAWVLPVTVNMISMVGWQHWVLKPSSSLSVLRHYSIFYFFSISIYLVSALVVIKLAILKRPLKTKNWQKKTLHLVCGSIWLLQIWVPLTSWALNNGSLVKDMAIYDCRKKPVESRDEIDSWFYVFETTVTLLLPCVIVIVAAIPTLRVLFKGREVSKRAHGKLRWQGILTVILTAAVLCTSCLPYLIFFYIKHRQYLKDPKTLADLYRVARYLPLLNIVSNFYIYCLTVVSFRKFLLSKLRGFVISLLGPSLKRSSVGLERDSSLNSARIESSW